MIYFKIELNHSIYFKIELNHPFSWTRQLENFRARHYTYDDLRRVTKKKEINTPNSPNRNNFTKINCCCLCYFVSFLIIWCRGHLPKDDGIEAVSVSSDQMYVCQFHNSNKPIRWRTKKLCRKFYIQIIESEITLTCVLFLWHFTKNAN